MNEAHKLPYKSLGRKLRVLREKSRESVAEAAGAVEIDEKDLVKIELGMERPSEDILLLLVNHFGLDDDNAAELWDLAGYEPEQDLDGDDDQDSDRSASSQGSRNTIMVMIDPRVMYTDQFEVTANKQGVVLDFSQVTGHNGQPLKVARVGMSREQAKTLMGVLHQALFNMENPPRKNLDSGSSDTKK